MGDLGRVKSVFELEVYKRAYAVSLQLHKETLNFPKYEQYGGLADQIRRASKSICANLAEGWGKQTTASERRQFVRNALGSAVEMIVWLDYVRDLEYADNKKEDVFKSEYRQICSMLGRLVQAD